MKKSFCIVLAMLFLLIFAACGNRPETGGLKLPEQSGTASDVLDSTSEPSSSVEPESSTAPESSTEPESGTAPESSAEPESSTAPESSTEPESSTVPESSIEPESSTAPESSAEPESSVEPVDGYTDPVVVPDVDTEKESDVLQNAPAPRPILLETEASGTAVQRNNEAVIDYSHTADGYVMVKYTDSCTNRLKVQVKGPKSTYTYNITPQEWEVFPLSEGNGTYKITIYRNVVDSKYATVLSATINVSLKNQFTTFLYPNQYVDYSVAPNTVEKAYQLTKHLDTPLDKVAAVYDYVVSALSYDKQKANTVQSGYLPVLDKVLASKKGICFDYAALMTGMLRSQGIPCKLIVGYAGSAYHAWISVWTEESGWVDGAIFFDGVAWHRMDPTFASSGDRSDSIMEYIGNGKNYTEKYLY